MTIDFEAIRPELERLCRKYDIVELSVFGSVARGDDRPDSDLDLLYVLAPDSSIGLEFMDAYEEFSVLLGRKVDLVPREHLHWIIRDRVIAESRMLYAA